MKKYILSKKASIFWDASQTNPENQCLRPGEVKELEETPKVKLALRHEGILLANESTLTEAGIDIALLSDAPAEAAKPAKVAAKPAKVAAKNAKKDNKAGAEGGDEGGTEGSKDPEKDPE